MLCTRQILMGMQITVEMTFTFVLFVGVDMIGRLRMNNSTKFYVAICPFCGSEIKMSEEIDYKTKNLDRCTHFGGVTFSNGEYMARFFSIKEVKMEKEG